MSYQPPPPPQQPPGGFGPPPGYPPPPMGPPTGGMPPLPPGGAAHGGPGWGGVPAYSPVDAMTYGWNKFTQNAGPFLVVAVLWLVVYVGVSGAFNLAGGGLEALSANPFDPDTPTTEASLASSVLQLVGTFVSGYFAWIVGMSLMRGALDVVDTGRTDLSQMFSRIPWGQAFVAGLLFTLATAIGLVVLCVGYPIAVFFLFYANAALLDGKSATDSMTESFNFVKNNFGDNLLLCLLGVVLGVITMCTCYLAGLITVPVMVIAAAYTWRVLQGRPAAP